MAGDLRRRHGVGRTERRVHSLPDARVFRAGRSRSDDNRGLGPRNHEACTRIQAGRFWDAQAFPMRLSVTGRPLVMTAAALDCRFSAPTCRTPSKGNLCRCTGIPRQSPMRSRGVALPRRRTWPDRACPGGESAQPLRRRRFVHRAGPLHDGPSRCKRPACTSRCCGHRHGARCRNSPCRGAKQASLRCRALSPSFTWERDVPRPPLLQHRPLMKITWLIPTTPTYSDHGGPLCRAARRCGLSQEETESRGRSSLPD